MPKEVDSCVSALLKKWKKDPSSRPKAKKKDQDSKSQAWAICSAAQKKQGAKAEVEDGLTIMLEDGFGTTFIGAAATNRPFIPQLEETRVDGEDEEKKLIVHLANPGKFYHWTGPFVLNRAVFSLMMHNFDDGVIGQKSAYDARHLPDRGALGWFERLFIDEGGRFFGEVDPTPAGLKAVEDKEFLYSSMEFHKNFERVDAILDLEDASTEPVVGCGDLDEAVEQYRLEAEAEESSSEENLEGNMSQEELQALQSEVTALKSNLETANTDREAARTELEQAQDSVEQERARATQLEQDALDTSIDAVILLAQNHRDEEGRGHSKALVEWLNKVLRFEDFGEGDGVVHLSDDESPSIGFRRYFLSVAQELIVSVPGVVPAQQSSSGGEEDPPDDDDDDHDYAAEWEH